jgi:hypothetical protein
MVIAIYVGTPRSIPPARSHGAWARSRSIGIDCLQYSYCLSEGDHVMTGFLC